MGCGVQLTRPHCDLHSSHAHPAAQAHRAQRVVRTWRCQLAAVHGRRREAAARVRPAAARCSTHRCAACELQSAHMLALAAFHLLLLVCRRRCPAACHMRSSWPPPPHSPATLAAAVARPHRPPSPLSRCRPHHPQSLRPRMTTSGSPTGWGTTSCCWFPTWTSPTWSECSGVYPGVLVLQGLWSDSETLLERRAACCGCWCRTWTSLMWSGVSSGLLQPTKEIMSASWFIFMQRVGSARQSSLCLCPLPPATRPADPLPALLHPCSVRQRVGCAHRRRGAHAREQGCSDEHRGDALRPLHRDRRRHAGEGGSPFWLGGVF